MRKNAPAQPIAIKTGKQAFYELINSPSSAKMSNILARAEFVTSSLWTERIFAVIANKITHNKKIENQYIFKAKDLVPADAKAGSSVYNSLEKIAKEISKEQIVFSILDEHDKEAMGGSVAIFTAAFWNNEEKNIALKFNRDLGVYLLEQAEKYTIFDIQEFLRLGSVYSQRLYRKLMSEVRLQKNYPTCRITIEELYFVMSPPAGTRKKFTVFEKQILKQAVKDINDNTTLKFNYEKNKIGRTIDSLIFLFDGTLMLTMSGEEFDDAKFRKMMQDFNEGEETEK